MQLTPEQAERLKKISILSLKIGLSVGIIAYLVWRAIQPREGGPNVFANLINQPKHWGTLAGAWVLCATATMLTLVRWWYLVRALDLPLRPTNALRIGFLGYLFNLAPMGIVGGDLLKAVMLAREFPEHRAKAVASVAVDRIIGLYMLFVLAAVSIISTGFWDIQVPEIRFICNLTFAATILGGVGIGALMTPGVTEGKLTAALGRIPRLGRAIEDLIEAIRMYRRQPNVLLNAAAMSLGVHSLFATGIYLIASGLPGEVLSLGTHFVVSPLSASTGALPLPMGPFELVLDFLYTRVPGEADIAPGQGLVVALAYRLFCILIAMIGVGYYLGSRQEVSEVMQKAEQDQHAEHPPKSETA